MERQETEKTIAGEERLVVRGPEYSANQLIIVRAIASDAIRTADPALLDEHNVEGTPLVAEIFKVLVACHIQNKNIRDNQERSARIQADTREAGGQLMRNIAPPQAYRESTIGDI